MSQRTAKVESYIHQSVATGLLGYLAGDLARITVTRVDVSPDLRQAIVWVGIVADEATIPELFKRVEGLQRDLQRDLASQLTMKYVPRLHFRLDSGGQVAAEMERLLRGL